MGTRNGDESGYCHCFISFPMGFILFTFVRLEGLTWCLVSIFMYSLVCIFALSANSCLCLMHIMVFVLVKVQPHVFFLD